MTPGGKGEEKRRSEEKRGVAFCVPLTAWSGGGGVPSSEDPGRLDVENWVLSFVCGVDDMWYVVPRFPSPVYCGDFCPSPWCVLGPFS